MILSFRAIGSAEHGGPFVRNAKRDETTVPVRETRRALRRRLSPVSVRRKGSARHRPRVQVPNTLLAYSGVDHRESSASFHFYR